MPCKKAMRAENLKWLEAAAPHIGTLAMQFAAFNYSAKKNRSKTMNTWVVLPFNSLSTYRQNTLAQCTKPKETKRKYLTWLLQMLYKISGTWTFDHILFIKKCTQGTGFFWYFSLALLAASTLEGDKINLSLNACYFEIIRDYPKRQKTCKGPDVVAVALTQRLQFQKALNFFETQCQPTMAKTEK